MMLFFKQQQRTTESSDKTFRCTKHISFILLFPPHSISRKKTKSTTNNMKKKSLKYFSNTSTIRSYIQKT